MMRCAFLLIAVLCGVFTKAQSTDAQSTLEKYLNEITKLNSFSGSVIVAIGDEILLNKGFGLADVELNVFNSKNTVHRIGSLTKQFTSLGVLKFFGDNDTISIDDNLSRFIPELPTDWGQITVFQLLTHTSGIPNYFGDLDAVPVEDTQQEIEKVIEMEKRNPRGLRNVPGSEFRYSNFGYCMLGYLIEVVSDQNYFDYVKSEILDPLAMDQTYYDDPRILIPNRSEGYKFSDGKLVNDALKDPAGYSAGGMLSSVNDMLKLRNVLKSNLIIADDLRERMFEPHLENYGLGWTILERNGRVRFDHNGGTHGFNSRIVYYPEQDVFIVVLANNEDVRSVEITCAIESIVFQESDPLLSLAYKFNMSSFEHFVGDYSNEFDEKRSIKLIEGMPFYINGESKFELVQESENAFRFAKYQEFKIVFSKGNSFTLSTCAVNPRIFEKI